MDLRILAGYLPNYAYGVAAPDTSILFDGLRELSHIDVKPALAADDTATPWGRAVGVDASVDELARNALLQLGDGTISGSAWCQAR